MNQRDLNILLAETAWARGWKDFKEKYFTHYLFWIAETGIGGVLAWVYGGGIALAFIAILFLGLLILTVATAPIRQRNELRQVLGFGPVYDSNAWLDLRKEFQTSGNDLDAGVAILWTTWAGSKNKQWNVWGEGSREFCPLAERAGNMLLRTPRLIGAIPEDVVSEKNSLWRWLCLLATDGTQQEMTGSGQDKDDKGKTITYESGGLKEAWDRSAAMCSSIVAKIS